MSKYRYIRLKIFSSNTFRKKISNFTRIILCLLIISSLSSNFIFTNIINSINNNKVGVNFPKTSTAPTFTIDFPSNYSLYGKIAPNYSLTISTGFGNFTWYEFLGLGVNSTPVELEGTSNENFEAAFNQTIWDSLSNGTEIFRFYVNNSLGEIGYLDAIIRIDILDPLINIIAPNGGFFNSTAPEYTVEISDPNLNTTWYTLNANQTKHIFTTNGTIDGWSYLSDGLVTIRFYANDSVSNENSDIVQTTKDTVNPTGSIIINGGDMWTNSTGATLSLTYSDSTSGVSEVRYSNDGSSWTAWEAAGGTRAWTLVSGEGTKTVYYEIKDNADLISQFTDSIDLDSILPTGSILIKNGDAWTNSTSVTISLTYGDATSGVAEVRYSNDGSSWTAWEAAGATRAWVLAGGDGTKTVYYEVKDNAELVSQFTDTIDLDMSAPTGSININNGGTWSNSTSVMLSLTYGDATSGVLEVRYSNDGSSWTAWEAAGATKAWTLTGGDGSKTVYYEVKNNAELVSQFTDTIILDINAPTGSIIINDGDTWSNSTSVSLSLTYGDATSGVLEVRYSNDGSSWVAWEAPGATRAWILVAGDGTKTVYYEVKDNAGLLSQFTDTIDLDTVVPTGSITINNGDTWTNSTGVSLSLTYGDSASGVAEVRYSNDGSSFTAWEAAGATRAWTLVGGDGTKTVYYEVKDNAELISQFTDTIILDATAPTGSIAINDDDTWTNSTGVSLSLTYGDATSGVLEVRYSNDGSSWTTWEAAGTTRAWTLLGGDGIKTVYYEVKNNAELVSQITDTIILDITVPTGSIIINDGDIWSNSTSISLSLTYGDGTSGVLEVRYSNDGSSWTAWEAPGATRAWTLVGGDGTNNVYYEVKDNAELVSQFTDTIILDTTVPTGSITINDEEIWTNSTGVSLSMTYGDATSGVLEVRYSNDGSSWTVWEAAGATRAWTLVSGDGTKTVYYEVKDNAELISQFTDTIDLDATSPIGSIAINDGDTWSNSTSVTLLLTYGDAASGVAEVRYSNDGSSWTAWEAAGTTRAWTLLGGDGIKTVYYEVKDNAALISQFSDTIILDTNAPTGAIIINDGDTWSNSTSVSLSLTYGDGTSGVFEVRYSNDGSSWTAWEAPGATRAWSLVGGDGSKTVYYEVKDNAGLRSQFTGTITLDTTLPTGSIIINNGDTWSNSTSVSLSLTYGDGTSGVLEVRYSNDGSSWTAWEAPSATRAWSLVGGDGSKTVYYEIKDNAELVSQFTDTIILDTTAPTGSIIINNGDSWTDSPSVSLSLTYSDTTSGVLEVRYSNDGSSWTSWELAGLTRAWTLSTGDGIKIVYYEIKDNVGFLSQFDDTIGLDTTDPIIIINDPINNSYYNSPPQINITIYEPNPSVPDCTYTVTGYSPINNLLDNNTEVTLNQDIWNALPEGEFQIQFTSFDIFGHRTDLMVMLYKDTKAPTIEINLPINNTYWNSSLYLNLNISAFDPNLDTIWYGVNNINITLANNIVQQFDNSIWNLLPNEGEFEVNIYANDTFGDLNNTYTLTLYKDVVAPTLIINSPLNNTYHKLRPFINVTVLDPYFNSLWYQVNSHIVFLTNNSNPQLTQVIWDDLPDEGAFTIYFYANDTAGNLNDLFSLDINRDIRDPIITINFPGDNNLFGDPAPNFELFINELNLNQTWYMLYNQTWNTLNYTFSGLTGTINQLAWGEFKNTNLTIRFYANDTLNNLGFNEVSIRKNIVAPIITIEDPDDYTLYGIDAPNITKIYKAGIELNTTWYTLDGGLNNFTFSGTNVLINQAAWDNYGFEDVVITFYINDSLGRIGFDVLTIEKDPNTPEVSISFIDPVSNNSYCAVEPTFRIIVYEPNLDAIWYRVGSTIIPVINNTILALNDTIWNGLPQGKFIIEVFATDLLGYINDSLTMTFKKDTLAPKLIIHQPSEFSYFNSPPPINITVLDPNFLAFSLTYTVTGYPPSAISLENNTLEFLNQGIWDILPQGEFFVEFAARDTFNHRNDTFILTLYKDTIGPILETILPMNNSYYSTQPEFKLAALDPNLDALWFKIDSETRILFNNSDYTLDLSLWNGISEGAFIVEFYANDSFGYSSSLVNLTLVKDLTTPFITINSPLNNTYYSEPPSMDMTIVDFNPDTIWYTVMGTKILHSGIGLFDTTIWNSLDQGEFQIHIFANDSAGNLNNSLMLTLFKDTLAPLVTVNLPLNNTYLNSRPTINVEAFDPNLDTIRYFVEGYYILLENGNDTTFLLLIWNLLEEGPFSLQIFATDTFGHTNNSIILTLYKDTIIPNIDIISPQPNDLFGENTPFVSLNVTDTNLDSVWYRLDNGTIITNYYLWTGSIEQSVWDQVGNGTVIIGFYANDTATNNDYADVLVKKNIYAPIISINSPYDNELFGINSPSFEIYTSGTDSGTYTWYTLIGGSVNYTFSSNTGVMDQDAWDDYGFGDVVIRFYINNSLGKIGSDEVSVRKDPNMPTILVNLPINQSAFATPPFIDLTVTDPNLHKVWYGINGETIDITNNLSISLDVLLWDNLLQGNFRLYLFANDTAGNLNNLLYLSLFKDTLGPNITIIQPTQNRRVGRNAPYFELLLNDVNGVHSSWYSVNGNPNITLFTGTVDRIDQTLWENLWDALPQDSIITIRFYSNDTLGNANFTEVHLIIDKPPDLPNILLYPLGFLIPLIGLVAMVPLTLKLPKTRYYKSLNRKDKKKLRKALITAGFFLSLLTLYFLI